MHVLKAVLFDLDDTLFDHRVCAQTALSELHQAHEPFRTQPFPDFEALHASLLEDLHRRVMTGAMPLEEARRERFRRLFSALAVPADEELIERTSATYRDTYRRIRQPIGGAAALLQAVKARAQVGIVSNNLLEEQQDKLRQCALEPYVDALVVSEEAGVSKPDPLIFAIALERLGCRATEAVMVGDSWPADVLGARAAGIPVVWFNPRRVPPPEPDAGVPELHALEPADAALRVIVAAAPAEQTPHAHRD